MRIQIASTAFTDGQPLPNRHTLDDQNISPDLEWSNVPSSAKSVALICDDPDAPAGTWVHWLVYNLTPSMTGMPEGQPKTLKLDNGAEQGINDFKRAGYDGPRPPPGKPHRYFFTIYALDMHPAIIPGLTGKELRKAMDGHIIAEGRLIGTYQKE